MYRDVLKWFIHAQNEKEHAVQTHIEYWVKSETISAEVGDNNKATRQRIVEVIVT